MKIQLISLALIASLAACGSGGNPFETEDDTTTGGETPDGEVVGDGEGTGIDRDGIPPGTASPSASDALFRSEARVDGEGPDAGNGYATGISYDSESDTFTVDNLAFDGDRPYNRGTVVSSLATNSDGFGEFNVYEGPTTAIDPVSGEQVNQFVYRAVYGVSRNRIANSDGTASDTPTTQFAIVRTGSYIDYGFGGFIYQRDTGVTLPNTLQATFSGKAGGLRDNKTINTLEYTSADVRIDIDFDDFNDGTTIRGDGVKGVIFNRRVIDLDGNDITSDVAALSGGTSIPNVVFEVGPDVLDNNGDLVTDVLSVGSEGEIVEEGKFYAIVSGENPDEIVGVFVLENDDTGARDTSGFIVYRDTAIQP